MKDLKEESMDSGGWVKFPPPPGMPALMANRFDRGGVQCEANILLDLRHDSLVVERIKENLFVSGYCFSNNHPDRRSSFLRLIARLLTAQKPCVLTSRHSARV